MPYCMLTYTETTEAINTTFIFELYILFNSLQNFIERSRHHPGLQDRFVFCFQGLAIMALQEASEYIVGRGHRHVRHRRIRVKTYTYSGQAVIV